MIDRLMYDELKAFPLHKFDTYAREEITKDWNTTDFLWKNSAKWAQIRKGHITCCFGLLQISFAQRPYFWFLLTTDFRPVYIRELAEAVARSHILFPDAFTMIEPRFEIGRKFAEFCGFRAVNPDEIILGENGKQYIRYEVDVNGLRRTTI